MIGEQIDISKLNFAAADSLLANFAELLRIPRLVLTIAGESGSGKTHMSAALSSAFERKQCKVLVLHMDDFFHLPPAQNHQSRLDSILNVGPQEVNLPRLNKIIDAFKRSETSIVVPQVHYHEDRIEEQEINIDKVDVLIVEGTYAFLLNQTDFHLFMSRNFEQTRSLREQRNRGNEVNDPFVEQVLAIEHQLITATKEKADAWIDIDFNLKYHAKKH